MACDLCRLCHIPLQAPAPHPTWGGCARVHQAPCRGGQEHVIIKIDEGQFHGVLSMSAVEYIVQRRSADTKPCL